MNKKEHEPRKTNSINKQKAMKDYKFKSTEATIARRMFVAESGAPNLIAESGATYQLEVAKGYGFVFVLMLICPFVN